MSVERAAARPEDLRETAPARGDVAEPLGDLRFRSLLSDAEWARLPPAVRRRFSKRLAAGGTAVYTGLVVEARMSRAGWLLAQALRLIGGPLPTGRGRSIDRVLRTTAPMHRGFAGGAFVDASGAVLGIATAAEIRGLGVVIPSDIAWRAADDVLKHGRPKRGYLGLAGQAVQLTGAQRDAAGVESALLVAGVVAGSPADQAGLLVGDVIVTFDGQPISSAESLLDAISGNRVGQAVTLKILRGGKMTEVIVTVGERT